MSMRDRGHGIAAGLLIALALTCGCSDTQGTVEEPEEEERRVWVPPYSPCEDNAFSCGELTEDAIARSGVLDGIVEEALEAGGDLEELAQTVRGVEGQNASVTGDMLMWWVDGGIPRILWTRSLPELVVPEDATALSDLDAFFASDESSIRSGSMSTRASGLSAHGSRDGFERNTKKVLILSPFYFYGRLWEQETDDLLDLFNEDEQYADNTFSLEGDTVTASVFRSFREFDVIHIISHGTQTLETAVGRERMSAVLTTFMLNKRAPEKGRSYTKDEFEEDILGKCEDLDGYLSLIHI